MLKRVPTSLVAAAICLVIAAWPTVNSWAEAVTLHHYLVHLLYLLSGSLCGMQTSWWVQQSVPASTMEEAGVVS